VNGGGDKATHIGLILGTKTSDWKEVNLSILLELYFFPFEPSENGLNFSPLHIRPSPHGVRERIFGSSPNCRCGKRKQACKK